VGDGSSVDTVCYGTDARIEPGLALVGLRAAEHAPTLRTLYLQVSGDEYEPTGAACPPVELPLGSDYVAAYFAHQSELRYPAGTGVPLGEGDHLNAIAIYDARFADGDFARRPTVLELVLRPTVEIQPVQWVQIGVDPLDLDPGGTPTADLEFFRTHATVHAAISTLYDFGDSFRVSLERGDEDVVVCAYEDTEFTPGGLQPVFFEPPIEITKGTLHCQWDTTGATETVHLGTPPDGELCLQSLLIDAP
jgi:hypothetical protein